MGRSRSIRALIFQLFGHAVAVLLFTLWWTALPQPLFRQNCGSLVLDRNERVLDARIAPDDQWRFAPSRATLPETFTTALVHFEDRRFYRHFGFDPLAILRAARDNLREGRIVSGASTISMQVIRLSRSPRPRSWGEKVTELLLAIRLEVQYQKEEILALYANNAPFGGNIVGLEAASWRYFNRSPHELSWAEAALLAVLPNDPARLHMERSRDRLAQKRDRLLDDLVHAGVIGDIEAASAKMEALPVGLVPLERVVPAIASRVGMDGRAGQTVHSSIDRDLQQDINAIAIRQARALAAREVRHLALLVVELSTNEVVAYLGNSPLKDNGLDGGEVDIIRSPRSSGSLFKPFLYAAMQDSGEMLPTELLVDIPLRFGSFSPKNHTRSYLGALPANQALARSLNVPFVKALAEYGVPRFKELLLELGFTSLYRPAEEYGLPLIIGGAETTLWDIAGAFGSLTRMIAGHTSSEGAIQAPILYRDRSPQAARPSPISPAAWYLAIKAMQELERPGIDNAWRRFADDSPIAWKTGTSQGLRDAWAVGMSPDYLVAVWAGNTRGPGTAGLRGAYVAAPVLFDVFRRLGPQKDFVPVSGLRRIEVSRESGFLPFPGDSDCVTVEATLAAVQSGRISPYHLPAPDPIFVLPPRSGVLLQPVEPLLHAARIGRTWPANGDSGPLTGSPFLRTYRLRWYGTSLGLRGLPPGSVGHHVLAPGR